MKTVPTTSNEQFVTDHDFESNRTYEIDFLTTVATQLETVNTQLEPKAA